MAISTPEALDDLANTERRLIPTPLDRELDALSTAVRAAASPMVVMRRVAAEALRHTQAADGAVVELAGPNRLTRVAGAGTLADSVGEKLDLRASLSGLAARTGQTLYSPDSRNDERVDQLAAARLRAASIICVPLRRAGETIGVLKVVAHLPDAFTPADVEKMAALGDFVSATIGAAWDISRSAQRLMDDTASVADAARGAGGDQRMGEFVANVLRPGLARESDIRRRVESLVAARAVNMVCQPIMSLDGGQLLGVEALARFAHAPRRSPETLLRQADDVGLGVELELVCAERALALLPQLPEHAFVAINVSPDAIVSPRLGALLADAPYERVVLELTERHSVSDYGYVSERIAVLRAGGVRLAIDDLGAGYASLAHIVHLRPDYIKLDRQFSRGIDGDPARRAVAHSLLHLARELSADMIAEGIESPAELDAVARLGIPYAQGYLLGRPRAVARSPFRRR